MRILTFLFLASVASPLLAEDSAGIERNIDSTAEVPNWREKELENGRLPVLIDFSWGYSTDFDSDYLTGPDLMLRMRFDDLFANGGHTWGQEKHQLALHTNYDWGKSDNNDAGQFLITAGYNYGLDWTTPIKGFGMGHGPYFPLGRETAISHGLGAAVGYSRESIAGESQDSLALEIWQYLGLFFFELRFREVFQYTSGKSIKSCIHIELHILRPLFLGALIVGVGWRDVGNNDAMFKVGLRVAF